MAEFFGKVVALTGAAGVLGSAVAARFARAGAQLLLLERDSTALEQLRAKLGKDHLTKAVDLTNRERTLKAIQGSATNLRGIDILCNIAGGFSMSPPVHAVPFGEWRQMFDVNVVTLLNAVAAVVPLMLAAGRGGKIINIGAYSAASGKAQMSAYVAAKSTIARITESMAAELRESGINVNCVLPSIIDTPTNRCLYRKSCPRVDVMKSAEDGR